LNIAVIDDEKNLLLSLKLYLEIIGHNAYTFYSPREALKEIPLNKIDLILLDLQMPEMTGEQVATVLKSKEATKDIPIIIFSAVENLEEVAVRVGAEGVLQKPFQFNKLEELIGLFSQAQE